jgi:predicted protein tyrosine phosphatase
MRRRQKMFWDMHHLLFANQGALAPEKLSGYAAELGLDVAAFEQCLSKGKHAAGIREDMRVAQTLGVTGTPAYVLARRVPGSDKVQVLDVVKGLPPYEVLEMKLNDLGSIPSTYRRGGRRPGGGMTEHRKKLLFVCGRNKRRSPTAERIFSRSTDFEVRARGVSASAVRRLSGSDVGWADVIFVMEAGQKQQVFELFRSSLGERPVHVLDIPDEYPYMDPELIQLLETGVCGALGLSDETG